MYIFFKYLSKIIKINRSTSLVGGVKIENNIIGRMADTSKNEINIKITNNLSCTLLLCY